MFVATPPGTPRRHWSWRAWAVLVGLAASWLELTGPDEHSISPYEMAFMVAWGTMLYFATRPWVTAVRKSAVPRRIVDLYSPRLVITLSVVWMALITVPLVFVPRSVDWSFVLPVVGILTVPAVLILARVGWELTHPPGADDARSPQRTTAPSVERAAAGSVLAMAGFGGWYYATQAQAEFARHGAAHVRLAALLAMLSAVVVAGAYALRGVITGRPPLPRSGAEAADPGK